MSKVSQSRRRFLATSGLTFGFSVAGVSLQLTPAQARQKGANLTVFSQVQATTLEYLAEAVVPGAKEAGVVHFIDSQLAALPETSLLMLKYLGVPAPFSGFYSASLDSAAQASLELYKKPIERISPTQLEQLVEAISTDKVDTWQGPPASFFYFVLRSDAVDTVYGTQQGFKNLEIPYMPHILPSTDW